MSRIAVTGAAGNVGELALEALGDHEVTAITHREHEGLDSVTLDITDAEKLTEAVADHDVIVHLAANADPRDSWDEVSDVNVQGTYNVFEAARETSVSRVVFASTNHVTHMYNAEDPTNSETLAEGARAVTTDEPVRPDTFYGVTKVTGEAFGSYYADRHGIEVVNLRIGWLLNRDALTEHATREESHARYAQAMWLSPEDCQQSIHRAVEANLSENPLTVNVVSNNRDRYLSLTTARCEMGYHPQDDSADVV